MMLGQNVSVMAPGTFPDGTLGAGTRLICGIQF